MYSCTSRMRNTISEMSGCYNTVYRMNVCLTSASNSTMRSIVIRLLFQPILEFQKPCKFHKYRKINSCFVNK